MNIPLNSIQIVLFLTTLGHLLHIRADTTFFGDYDVNDFGQGIIEADNPSYSSSVLLGMYTLGMVSMVRDVNGDSFDDYVACSVGIVASSCYLMYGGPNCIVTQAGFDLSTFNSSHGVKYDLDSWQLNRNSPAGDFNGDGTWTL